MEANLSWLITILCLVASVAVSTASATEDDEGAQKGPIALRPVELPKIFDYLSYVQIYGKHYLRPSELANRARLFFARASKVFIQMVKYLHRLSNKFFALNHMSDWTPEERRASFGVWPLKGRKEEPAAIDALDLATIKSDLSTIVQHRDERPEYELIAEQLEAEQQQQPSSSGRRKRRDVGQEQHEERRFSAENLMRNPSEITEEESPKLVHLEDPQILKEQSLASTSSGPAMEEIPDEERKEIEQTSLMSSLMSTLGQFWPLQQQLQEDQRLAALDPSETLRPSADDEIFLDYRQSGCLATVRQQSKCGSCYIFSMIAIYEYHYCKQNGQLIEFSEQYPIDCGIEYGLNGCAGGRPDRVGEFVGRFGLEPRDYYSYKAENRTCPYEVQSDYQTMGRIRLEEHSASINMEADQLSDEAILFLLENKGPLSVSIMVSEDFVDYGGGLDLLDDYEPIGGHGMVLIGHGRQDGRDYWLIRNSHGLSWGDKGHYKLDKQSNKKHLLAIDFVQAEFRDNPMHDLKKTREGLYKNARLSEKLVSWINSFQQSDSSSSS